MPRFVSEPLTPLPGRFGVDAMVRGEPGLPAGFAWRGREHRIAGLLEQGKTTDTSEGEAYVHRHTWRLEMEDGAVWSIYFLRRPPRGGSLRARKQRWFLRSVEDPQM